MSRFKKYLINEKEFWLNLENIWEIHSTSYGSGVYNTRYIGISINGVEISSRHDLQHLDSNYYESVVVEIIKDIKEAQ